MGAREDQWGSAEWGWEEKYPMAGIGDGEHLG